MAPTREELFVPEAGRELFPFSSTRVSHDTVGEFRVCHHDRTEGYHEPGLRLGRIAAKSSDVLQLIEDIHEDRRRR